MYIDGSGTAIIIIFDTDRSGNTSFLNNKHCCCSQYCLQETMIASCKQY